MLDFEGDGYFAELDSYEARREYEEWLDRTGEADLDDSFPEDMAGEEDFA